MEHRKPKTVSRKLDPEKQAAFIKAYEEMLNNLESDEAVLFADAVHPTHAVRPVGCWAPKETPIAMTKNIADPCYLYPRNFGSPLLYVVREMTTRFGNDFTSALNQP